MNLYVHFPFCRSKCRYCALYSCAGVSPSERDAYVRRLADGVCPQSADGAGGSRPCFETVYFGGGSPGFCDLTPMLTALAPHLSSDAEFTVELNPLDVSDDLLALLRDGGVNRISMGVQSLDDATLTAMGRGYTVHDAAKAFARIRKFFDNAGLDLIVGFPGDPCADFSRLADWGLAHASVYSLQNERRLENVPDDDWVLDRIRSASEFLSTLGLRRYEISNYARPGFECRHNLAVWRGEDYWGLGDGAFGRLGLKRTKSLMSCSDLSSGEVETVSPQEDELERLIFRLRTRDGLDARGRPEWAETLAVQCRHGLLTNEDGIYRLTSRGTEVCDAILSELVEVV